jgi:hypothetical protein
MRRLLGILVATGILFLLSAPGPAVAASQQRVRGQASVDCSRNLTYSSTVRFPKHFAHADTDIIVVNVDTLDVTQVYPFEGTHTSGTFTPEPGTAEWDVLSPSQSHSVVFRWGWISEPEGTFHAIASSAAVMTAIPNCPT